MKRMQLSGTIIGTPARGRTVLGVAALLVSSMAWATLSTSTAYGQLVDEFADTVGEPVAGDAGITETVAELEAREAEMGRLMGPPALWPDLEAEYPDRSDLPTDPLSPDVAQWPPAEPGSLGAAAGRSGEAPFLPQTVGTSFLAVQYSESFYCPPDTQGAVGPTQVGVVVNGKVKWTNKTGGGSVLSVSLDNLFQSVRDGWSCGDPRVRFDRTSNRWFVSAMNIPSS